MAELSEEQVLEFKEAFSLFDKDGDGKITTKVQFYKALGRAAAEGFPNQLCNIVLHGKMGQKWHKFMEL